VEKKTFQMVVFMICGPCLGWHGPKVARRAFGPCWAVVSGLRPSTARPGKIPCLIGPARFSPKHDGSVPCRPGTAQLSALVAPHPGSQGHRHRGAQVAVRRLAAGAAVALAQQRWHHCVAGGEALHVLAHALHHPASPRRRRRRRQRPLCSTRVLYFQ